MTASLWPDVVAGLISAWTQTTSWPVFDGQPHTYDRLEQGVSVGINPDVEQTSGGFRQEWRDAGPAPFAARQETGTVRCSIWRQTGNATDITDCRQQVFAVLDALVAATAGITPVGVPALTSLIPVTSAEVLQQLTADGTVVELVFTVAYTGLVT